jgi:hypothetical protein
MPGFVIVANATVLCSHGGQAKPTGVMPRVTIGGQPVVVQGPPFVVSGCAMPPPPSGNGPCVTAVFSTAAVRVKAGGMPVLLQDSQATCVPTGTPVSVVFSQPRVRAT